MTIELSSEQEALIQKYLATGRFADQRELISEALRLLEKKSGIESSSNRTLGAGKWHGNIKISEDFDELPEEIMNAFTGDDQHESAP